MLYSCTHLATVGVKGLKHRFGAGTVSGTCSTGWWD